MRAAIYNRWLATLGGGEKLSLSVAEYLSKHFSVDVISHTPVPKEQAESRLSLDLSGVNFVTIPDRQSIEVSLLTSEYDFFINTSFMEYFPSFAKYSANLVYFPARLDPRTAWGRQLKLYLRRKLKLPAVLAGFQAFVPERQNFKWKADTLLKIRLPENPRNYSFRLAVCSLDERLRNAHLELNGEPVKSLLFPNPGAPVISEVVVPGGHGKAKSELTVIADDPVPADGYPKMEISKLWLDLPEYRIYQTLLERWLHGVAVRLQYYPPGVSILDYIDTYSQIWAISEFSQKWIKTYWKRDSQILTPPVNLEDYQVGIKRNQILSVGRFFAGQHNKMHLAMIQAFKDMVDHGLTGWELHLAGGKTPGEEHAAYLAGIIEQSQGYPITIHTDISFPELIRLYAESAIYWHASGYGEEENRDPVKFEHFGITTVEAMASGCVPVVIGKGGQPEIVNHGTSGYLWHTLQELEDYSLHLIRNTDLRESMSISAFQDSKIYGKDQFHSRIDLLLEQIGINR